MQSILNIVYLCTFEKKTNLRSLLHPAWRKIQFEPHVCVYTYSSAWHEPRRCGAHTIFICAPRALKHWHRSAVVPINYPTPCHRWCRAAHFLKLCCICGDFLCVPCGQIVIASACFSRADQTRYYTLNHFEIHFWWTAHVQFIYSSMWRNSIRTVYTTRYKQFSAMCGTHEMILMVVWRTFPVTGSECKPYFFYISL